MPEWEPVGKNLRVTVTVLDVDSGESESETLTVTESWNDGWGDAGFRGRDVSGVLTELNVRTLDD